MVDDLARRTDRTCLMLDRGDVKPGSTALMLLDHAVDYAGLFPPASRSLNDAARRYGEHRRGADEWMLGRFVLPASRLDELSGYTKGFGSNEPWRLSVLAATGDLGSIDRFVQMRGTGAVVDAIETKAATVDEVIAFPTAAIPHAPDGDAVAVYVEVPVVDDPTGLVRAIKSRGLRAKVRTGGITPDAFPTAAQLARFLSACSAADVMFKATAGLHQAVSGNYPLTYEAGSACAPMFGFLNLFLATTLLGSGLLEHEAIMLLEERDVRAFNFGGDAISWRGHVAAAGSIRDMRRRLGWSFGSCAFSEPVNALRSMGLL